MKNLLEKHFVVVGGKGGVGRTVVSLALGRLAAASGKRVLVCLCNAPPRYTRLVGGVSLGPDIATVSTGLEVVNLEPRASQEEYGRTVIHSRLLHKVVFGSRIVRSFLDAVPGLAEWSLLGKATFHALPDTTGARTHDLVVFDSPATGHGLDILRLPSAIASTIPAGRLRDEAMARVELLSDPSRCEVVPVTLAEDIPVRETTEYVERLRAKGLSVRRIVVNRVEVGRLSPGVEELLDSWQSQEPPDWLLPAAVTQASAELQESCLCDLQRLGLPLVLLPHLRQDELDEESLDALHSALTRAASPRPCEA